MSEGCTGPLWVSRLLPDSIRTRSTQRRRRSVSSGVSSRQSSWRRRPLTGVAPAASTASRAASTLSKRSLISRSSVAVMTVYLIAGSGKLQRNRTAERTVRLQPSYRAQEHVHRETLERERPETEIARHGHLENLEVLHDRHRVMPFRARPVIPEFPQHAAQASAEQQV